MNVVDILETRRIPYKRTGQAKDVRQGWVGIETCPYCGHGNYYLAIHLATGRCSCWACGSHRLGETIQRLTGASWADVKSWLAGLDLERLAPRPRGKLELPKGLGPLLRCHRDYLRGRRFDPDALAEIWGLQGIGLAPKYAWRIFIPVIDRGRIVSWTTRSIGTGVRYLSAPAEMEATPIKETLFGLDLVRHAIVVTEGPFDALRLGPGAVATMGVGYSETQKAIVSKFPVRAVCFDNEPGAQKRAVRLVQDLAIFPGQTFRVELDAKDPGEASEKEVRRLRRSVFKEQ